MTRHLSHRGTASFDHVDALSALLDEMPAVLIVTDDDDRIEWANSRAAQAFGYRIGELQGKALSSLLADGSREPGPGCERAYEHRVTPRYGRHRDGHEFPLEVESTRFTIAGNAHIVHLIRDASVQQRTQAALQRSQQLFDLFVAHAPVAVAVFDREMRYLEASQRWRRDYALGEQPLAGRSLYDVFPDLPPHLRAIHRRGLRGETVRMHSDRFECADGTSQLFDWEVHPWREANGAIGGIVILAENVTERESMAARFRAVVEVAPIGLVMTDADGIIALANRAAYQLFGYARDELLGRSVDTLVPERLRQGHAALRERYFAGPEQRPMGAGRELYGLRRDGSEFPLEIGLTPVRANQALFVLATVVDISERSQQAAALLQAYDALLRSNLDLQQFAYAASHDLQTPLRSIASFLDLLQRHYAMQFDDRAGAWIRRAIDAARQLQTLIQNLLDYSRIDAQAHPFEPVSMIEVFEHCIDLLDASIHEAAAEVRRGPLPIVMGDRSQLVQVMLNLIGNALKYRGPGPLRVRVSAECIDGHWRFAVADNGIGIAPQHRQRIFEIFRRLHTAQEIPGTGIGLAICRRVIHRHGGEIWVESEPDRGSTFYFTLPDPKCQA